MTTADIRKLRQASRSWRYTDYVRRLPDIAALVGDVKPLRIAIVGSYTMDPVKPILEVESLLDGYPCDILVGDYNQYAQEILDPTSALYDFDPDFVVMMVRLEEVLPAFVDDFPSQSADDWRESLRDAAAGLAELADRCIATCGCQMLVQNAAAPSHRAFGIHDGQRADGQAMLVAGFNAELAASLEGVTGAQVWDFADLSAKQGADSLFDAKMWYLSRNPFRLAAYPLLAADVQKHLRALRGDVKKCIVLDLDNTLWGGVVGEDGVEGIALGNDYPGNCFRAFQRELLTLEQRGLILAINSKNNDADAIEAIENHPDMLLRMKHFAATRINWIDKSENLRQLADELNIGLDSMIMIDDNDVECAMIEQQLPDFDVYCLPKNPYEIPGFLESIPGLENISVTSEDRQKAEMYRAQVERRKEQAAFSSLDDFLASLELKVEIAPADTYSVPRIAQLTQKTNQFNMTTRRYADTDITAMVADPGKAVFAVSAEDRFGVYGIVGVVILDLADDTCVIETFLMSCRVIGRKIENAIMAFVADFAAGRGMQALRGEFLPTAKNAPAADVYERVGLGKVDDTHFEARLDDLSIASPVFIDVTRPGAAE